MVNINTITKKRQMPVYYISQIPANNRQKKAAYGICLSLHVMSIFSRSAVFAVVR